MSFSDYSIVKESHFVGIDNYVRLFAGQDPYFYKSLTVTVIYVVFSVPTSIVFAFLIASLLNKSVKGKGLFRTLFLSALHHSDRSHGRDLDVDIQSGRGPCQHLAKGSGTASE